MDGNTLLSRQRSISFTPPASGASRAVGTRRDVLRWWRYASQRPKEESVSINYPLCVLYSREKKLPFLSRYWRAGIACARLWSRPGGDPSSSATTTRPTIRKDPVMATHPSRARLNARNTKCAPPRQKLKMECSRATTRRGDYVSDVVNYRYPRKMRDLARRFSCTTGSFCCKNSVRVQ